MDRRSTGFAPGRLERRNPALEAERGLRTQMSFGRLSRRHRKPAATACRAHDQVESPGESDGVLGASGRSANSWPSRRACVRLLFAVAARSRRSARSVPSDTDARCARSRRAAGTAHHWSRQPARLPPPVAAIRAVFLARAPGAATRGRSGRRTTRASFPARAPHLRRARRESRGRCRRPAPPTATSPAVLSASSQARANVGPMRPASR
jgi:hypothetical protein